MKTRYWLLATFLVITLGGCGGGGGGGGETTAADTTAPTASVNLTATSLPRPDDTVVVVTFSESMDVASLALGGGLGAESDGGTWSATGTPNDTLTIAPATGWTSGADRVLTIDARDLAGNPLQTLTVAMDVAAGTWYYVDAAQPNNSGDGLSPATAKRSIMAAVSAATAPASVLVAGGTYDVTYQTDHVILAEGVSLFGGFSPDFTQRDRTTHPSVIHDLHDGAGTNYLNPARAVEAGAGITTTTVFDGFTVLGADTAGAASGETATAAYVYGGAEPTISRNLLKGGSGERSNGVAIYQSSPVITGNTIHSGTGTSFAFGIYAVSSSPLIVNNLVTAAGTGTGSYGISYSGGAVIRNNIINGGTGGTYSVGIDLGSPATDSAIENNIVFTTGGSTRLCLWEGNDTNPGALRNNDLFDCPDAYYAAFAASSGTCPFYVGSDCYTDIADVNDASLITQGTADSASGNVSVDPLFVDVDGVDDDPATVEDNLWYFRAVGTSPCTVTQGGLDGTVQSPAWGIFLDKDGNVRTAPWSIGAYEYDGDCVL